MAAYKNTPTPVSLNNFDESLIDFKNIYINQTYNVRSVPIVYKCTKLKDKLVVLIKNCRIIATSAPNEKCQLNSLYVSITDKDVISLFQKIEHKIKNVAVERRVEWFNNDAIDMDEINEIFRPSIVENTKYKSHNMNINLSKFIKIVNMGVPTNEDPLNILQANQIIDLCIEIDKVKPAIKTLKISYIATKVKITGKNDDVPQTASYFPYDFDENEFKFGNIETNENGGKFVKLTYKDASPTFALNNINGRIFHNVNEYEDYKTKEKKMKDVYSLSLRLTREEDEKLYKRIDKALYEGFKKGHINYLGRNKAAKDSLLESLYCNILYNKEDRDRIKNKEQPKNCPSLRISIYWNNESGFGNRFTDTDGKPINDNDIINKPLTIKNLEFYCKHMWFGKEATTIKFILSKCSVENDTPDYNMDDIAEIDNSTQNLNINNVVDNNTTKISNSNGIVSDSDED